MPRGKPWYPHFPADFLIGVQGMPLEEVGAYAILLNLLYERNAALPDDANFLAGQLGIARQKWTVIRQRLLDRGKLVVIGGDRLTNARFERERAAHTRKREKRAKAGAAGGRKAAEKRQQSDMFENQGNRGMTPPPQAEHDNNNSPKSAESAVANATAKGENTQKSMTPAMPPPPYGESYANHDEHFSQSSAKTGVPNGTASLESRESILPTNLSDSDSAPRPNALDDADLHSLYEAVCEAAGYCPTSPNHIAMAHEKVAEWRKAGYDFSGIVIPTIQSMIVDSPDPTYSLKRFDKRLQHEHARAKAAGTRRSYAPPVAPVTNHPLEEPEFEALREALMGYYGPKTFATITNLIHFKREEGDILRVCGPAFAVTVLHDSDLGRRLKSLAPQFGFKRVI